MSEKEDFDHENRIYILEGGVREIKRIWIETLQLLKDTFIGKEHPDRSIKRFENLIQQLKDLDYEVIGELAAKRMIEKKEAEP